MKLHRAGGNTELGVVVLVILIAIYSVVVRPNQQVTDAQPHRVIHVKRSAIAAVPQAKCDDSESDEATTPDAGPGFPYTAGWR